MKNLPVFILFVISVFPLSGNDGYPRNPLIDITNYTFTVALNDASNNIIGSALISISFKGDMASFELDLKNRGSDGKGMVVDSVFFSEGRIKWEHRGNRILVTTDSPIKTGINGILKIKYHGIPADGLIISNNKFGQRTFFSDHWPDRASNYLPCIDHPSDKATVDFIIIAPEHYEIVASGYLIEQSHMPEKMKVSHWREDIPLAVKVMAFGAAQFDIQLAGDPENIPVWSYVFPENAKAGFNDYSVAVKPVSFFSKLIGPYPYEKLANVQSKTIFGGLENAGCIFYSERSVTGKGRAEGLLAHEIAHQWFGNSVTENDWHHIWLSEGFATYLTAVYMEKTHGEEKMKEEMKSARERVIKQFLRTPSPVIDTTISDLMKLLSANSYQKGAWVLHMLRREVGEETFWKGMRLFYGRYLNKNAMTDDFKNIMEEVSRKDLDGFFKQWLYYAGQPDLKISGQPAAKKGWNEILIEQKQQVLYRFTLELLINTPDGSIRESLPVSERITRLSIKSEKVDEIIPDPDVNLLFRIMTD